MPGHGMFSAADFPSIQAAIDAAVAYQPSVQWGPLKSAAKVWVPPGVYEVGSLDLTGCAGLHLQATPGTVVFYATHMTQNRPVIDLTGSSSCTVEGIIASGQNPDGTPPSVWPSTGFLLSESSLGDSNKNRLVNCGTLGWFTVASLYLLGSTDNLFDFCAFQQDHEHGAVCYASTFNAYQIQSDYASVAQNAGNQGDTTFLQCEFHGHRSSAATFSSIQLWSVDNMRFFGGNFDNSGPSHVRWNGTNKKVSFLGPKFYSESGHASEYLFWADNSGCDGLLVHAPNEQDNAYSAGRFGGSGGYPNLSWMA